MLQNKTTLLNSLHLLDSYQVNDTSHVHTVVRASVSFSDARNQLRSITHKLSKHSLHALNVNVCIRVTYVLKEVNLIIIIIRSQSESCIGLKLSTGVQFEFTSLTGEERSSFTFVSLVRVISSILCKSF